MSNTPQAGQQVTVSLDDDSISRLAAAIALALRSSAAAHDENVPTSEEGPLLLGATEVAKLLNIGARTVWKMRSSGRLPQSIHIGRSVKWRLDEITAWVEAGCLPLSRWEWTPRQR